MGTTQVKSLADGGVRHIQTKRYVLYEQRWVNVCLEVRLFLALLWRSEVRPPGLRFDWKVRRTFEEWLFSAMSCEKEVYTCERNVTPRASLLAVFCGLVCVLWCFGMGESGSDSV